MAISVLVPPLGQTVDAVTLVSWYKQEGEAVAQGEMLFAIETDKATLDIEAPASGVLCRVTARPGDEVHVLSAIALIAAPGKVLEEGAIPSGHQPSTQGHSSGPAAGPGEGDVQARGRRDRIFVSPRARRLAEERGISLADLQPSGPEGAIVERDVRAYLDARVEARISPVARRVAQDAGLDWRSLSGSGPGGRIMRQDVAGALHIGESADEELLETIPLRGVRAVIAERMAHSAATTARVTLNTEADATALVELRRQLAEDGGEVSYNALLLHILGRALRDHPRLNASLQGDTIQVWRRVHIGLAVDSDRGLLVPVVRDVDRKGLAQLEAEIRSLAGRARAGQCPPEELGGGTFTLTNLGMFGIDSFTPIINLPECAILGVGRIRKQLVVPSDLTGLEDLSGLAVRQMVWLSLTFDHRLVDGAPAARFMQRVVQLIERPHLLLI
ncbi:MAG: 2-oxo acid dehydrogenase subunit E2 [Armatimonadetes bacterium]|nr:2-oxo acid dehydrogenase subunit E2 [Armatimonadota bacterium]